LKGGKEPKKELARLIRAIRDGEESSVGFANVEVNLGKARAVDSEC